MSLLIDARNRSIFETKLTLKSTIFKQIFFEPSYPSETKYPTLRLSGEMAFPFIIVAFTARQILYFAIENIINSIYTVRLQPVKAITRLTCV